MSGVSYDIDRYGVVFDDESLVADAGLLAAGTLMDRLGLEALVDRTVRLGGRVGGARPGRRVLTLVAAMLVGGSHIDHVGRLRSGSSGRVLPHAVMAPSTVGTFLRSFTWGHVRQLDKAASEALGRVWAAGAGPGNAALTLDLDSTILCGVGQGKGRRRPRVYEGVGLSPPRNGPGRHGRDSWGASAGRGITARCGPFRSRNHRTCAEGRSFEQGHHTGRLWVLVR